MRRERFSPLALNDERDVRSHVGSWVISGLDVLTLSFSHFDPLSTDTLWSECQDSALQRSALTTALCYPLGLVPRQFRARTGKCR